MAVTPKSNGIVVRDPEGGADSTVFRHSHATTVPLSVRYARSRRRHVV